MGESRQGSRDIKRKIVDAERLVAAVEAARADGRTVVHCHGCFDIVHPGHVRYLEFARRQGDVLIVSITPDDAAGETTRPYIPEEMRAENLAALVFVDYVTVTDGPSASGLLDSLRPDVFVKGREYERSTDGAFVAEKRVVESYGGRIIFSSGETVYAANDIHDRVSGAPDFASHHLNLYCRRHGIDRDQVERTLASFRNLNVLVVGDVVLDRYVYCDALGVASESPVMSLVERDCNRFLGGAAIVARHVAALGARSFLLSAVSDDQDGAWTQAMLDDEHVECHLLKSRPAMVEKTRYLVDDTKVMKVDRAQSCPLDSIAERHAAMMLEQQAKLADAVIFCDFGYGMITGALLERVLPALRHNVRILTADVSGGRANLLNFRTVDLLCPTEREARSLLSDYDSGLSAMAWNLLERTEARHLFITLEKRGMVVFQRRSQDRTSPEWSGRLLGDQLPSFADRVVDRLGCGDALLATSTLALAAGAAPTLSAYLGNAAASIEIGMLGNRPVEFATLSRWFRHRPELVGVVKQGDLPAGDVARQSVEKPHVRPSTRGAHR